MNKRILGIGATLVDELYFCDQTIVEGSSNPAHKIVSVGGVISNIMQQLSLFGIEYSLITAIGTDGEATYIKNHFKKVGVPTKDLLEQEGATGKYVSVLHADGNLFVSVCEDSCSRSITVPFLESKASFIQSYDLIVIDTNLEAESIQWLIDCAREHHIKLVIEPVSVSKAMKLRALNLNGVSLITPNEEELMAISKAGSVKEETELVEELLERGVDHLWVRKGAQGSVWYQREEVIPLGVPEIDIIDSTGAGDAALAGWLVGWVHEESDLDCLQLGHALALTVLQTKGSIQNKLNKESLYNIKKEYYHD